MDIIVFALARWDGAYSSTALSLAKSLSKRHRVFYIDNPYTYFSLIKDRKKPAVKWRLSCWLRKKNCVQQPFEKLDNFYAVCTPLMLPINALPRGLIYNTLYRLNNLRLQRWLLQLTKRYGVNQPVYLNIFNPFYAPTLTEKANPALNIYYTVDAIEASEYIKKHGPALENKAIGMVDFALATSRNLQNKKAALNKVHYLPNAADVALFETARNNRLPKPEELHPLENEIIIYTGNMSVREDYTLLEKIALRFPDKHLVLVGPVNTKNKEEEILARHNNVIFTGPKDLSELPAFLQHAHCAIIPFLCNALTAGIYPLKINEYLASGIPVVGTRFSEDITSFSAAAYLAKNHEEFLIKIERAIAENNEKKAAERAAFASSNTWDARAKTLEAFIADALAQ